MQVEWIICVPVKTFVINWLNFSFSVYATHVLRMDIPAFKRAWNTKPATHCRTVKQMDAKTGQE